jgi:hypothetical protein
VKDFGAVGDGVTDDTAAIQAAIDAATIAANTGVSLIGVLFPAGTYKVSSVINVVRNIRLQGIGWPIIKAFHNGDIFHYFGIPDSSTFPDNKFVVESLTFKNNPGNVPTSFIRLGDSTGDTPTYVKSADDVEIISCTWNNCSANYIIDNNRGFGLVIKECIFTACVTTAVLKLRQNQTEIPYWTYSVNVYTCDFTGITGKAIEADGGDISMFGGIVEGCSAGAIDLGINTSYTGAQIVSFYGTYLEANQIFHVRGSNGRLIANFNGVKFVKGIAATNNLIFPSAALVSFYNCSSPNQSPTITGGNIKQYGCTYMSSNIGTVDSFDTDRGTSYTSTPMTPVIFRPSIGDGQSLLATGSLGGGGALVLCSHSTGGTTNCITELFLIMRNVNGSSISAQSISRLAGADTATFAFSVDANGYVQVTSSAVGHANYKVIAQSGYPVYLPA